MAKGGKNKKKKADLPEGARRIATNRKARFNFDVDEKMEAGIVLKGTEVKSLRNGNVTFKDAYARIKDDEVFLYGLHIAPYTHAGELANHDPERVRKLLLHRREIDRLIGKIREKGYTMVPLAMYFRNGTAKVQLALAKGKRQYNKREDIRERDAQREMDRAASKH